MQKISGYDALSVVAPPPLFCASAASNCRTSLPNAKQLNWTNSICENKVQHCNSPNQKSVNQEIVSSSP